jgi:hypothetical protein
MRVCTDACRLIIRAKASCRVIDSGRLGMIEPSLNPQWADYVSSSRGSVWQTMWWEHITKGCPAGNDTAPHNSKYLPIERRIDKTRRDKQWNADEL